MTVSFKVFFDSDETKLIRRFRSNDSDFVREFPCFFVSKRVCGRFYTFNVNQYSLLIDKLNENYDHLDYLLNHSDTYINREQCVYDMQLLSNIVDKLNDCYPF